MFGNMFFSAVENDDEYNKLLKEVMETDYSCFYRGTVVDNDDPMQMGRVRVRIPQIYGSEEQRDQDIYTPTYAIPWATSAIMAGAGNNTGAYLIPNIGDTVFVAFENGDSKLPMYFGGLLTKNGENKFIGTPDANGGKLYKTDGDDFNTDITNKSQRVLYKSIKGATILIDDKDGDESIKIIDQLGQFISLENVGGEILNRDRSDSVNVDLAKCGRIVIKDAYEDSIALHGGEIHVKTPKLIIETDDLQKQGFDNNDSYPDEVSKALEILGETEEDVDPPPPPEYDYFYCDVYNDTDQEILVGVIYNSNVIEYEAVETFDSIAVLRPGETMNDSKLSSDITGNNFTVSIIRYDMYAKYNETFSWNSSDNVSINASDVLSDGGRFYSKVRVDLENMDDNTKNELLSDGRLKLTNTVTGEIFYNYLHCVIDSGATGYTVFYFGREFYFVKDRGGNLFYDNFFPITQKTLGLYDVSEEDESIYCKVPIPNGTYTANVFTIEEDYLEQSLYIYGGTYNDWVGIFVYNQSYLCRLCAVKLSFNTGNTIVVGPIYNTPNTQTGGTPISGMISSDVSTYGISFFMYIRAEDYSAGYATIYLGIPGSSGVLDDQFKSVVGCSFSGSNDRANYQTMLGSSADTYQLPDNFFETEYAWYIMYRVDDEY